MLSKIKTLTQNRRETLSLPTRGQLPQSLTLRLMVASQYNFTTDQHIRVL